MFLFLVAEREIRIILSTLSTDREIKKTPDESSCPFSRKARFGMETSYGPIVLHLSTNYEEENTPLTAYCI
jgi:hypothetical protein